MNGAAGASRLWLANALATVVLWGFWGAFSGLSPQYGFPETLVYCVWALTMVPPALFILARAGWKLDTGRSALAHGLAVGLLGAGGQMILFHALTRGPAYLIFPVISLSPIITIALSYLVLGERTGRLGALGIVLALIALPLFDFAPDGDGGGTAAWLLPAIAIMVCWGVQAYVLKAANMIMSGESIFFYMMLTGLLLAPVAWAMTPDQAINWGWSGPGLAAAIQVLNAIGALTLVFAFRYGKAIVVAPLTNAGAPLATAVISLVLLGAMPGPLKALAIALATIAAIMLAIEPDSGNEKK